MLSNFLQDRAVMYLSGALAAPEREEFELMLEFHEELRAFVTNLGEVGATLTLAATPADRLGPSTGLKDRVLGAIANRPSRRLRGPGRVESGGSGLLGKSGFQQDVRVFDR